MFLIPGLYNRQNISGKIAADSAAYEINVTINIIVQVIDVH